MDNITLPSPLKVKPIQQNSFTTISVLGIGHFAKVLLVKNKKNSTLYAMKIVKKKEVKKKDEKYIKTERDILAFITDHPFLIQFHSSFQTESKLYFILEYCPGGELFNLLKKKKKFTEAKTRFFIAQIILALEHLHKFNVLYRDLKPENILIDKNGNIKLTDFGLSKMNISNSDNKSKTICGTDEYLAPEIINGKGYGKMVDWWTLGCLIYELLTGKPPFYNSNIDKLFTQIKNENPFYHKFISKNARDLIGGLLRKNRKKRLGRKGSKEIKSHVFFKGVDWGMVLRKGYVPFFVPKVGGDDGLRNFDPEFTEMEVSVHSVDSNNSGEIKQFEDFSWEPSSN